MIIRILPKALLAIVFILSVQLLQARSIQPIIVIADNYPNPANNKIAGSMKINLKYMKYFIKKLKASGAITVKTPVIIKGRSATGRNMMDAIKKAKVGKNDVLFVYYGGHGGMSRGKTFIYACDEKMLLRSDLEKAMKAKKSRLKILITDCCSSSIDTMPSERAFSLRSGNTKKNLKTLFNNYKGFYHITAATEGEYGWGSSVGGGYFTEALISKVLTQNPPASWENVSVNTRALTVKTFKRSYRWISDSYKTDMKKKGIKGQHPKTYSLPKLVRDSGGTETTVITKKRLPTPQNLTASQGKYSNKIVINWKNVPGAEGYVVMKWHQGMKNWKLLPVTKKLKYVDQKVKRNVTYAYLVVALTRTQRSDFPNYVTGWVKLKKAKVTAEQTESNEYRKETKDDDESLW